MLTIDANFPELIMSPSLRKKVSCLMSRAHGCGFQRNRVTNLMAESGKLVKSKIGSSIAFSYFKTDPTTLP